MAADLSMVETLQIWNEAVSLTEKGSYEQALERFLSLEERDSAGLIITSARNLFNIGQIYLSMGRTNMAAQAFEEALENDTMLAVGHFVLGNANLRRNRYDEALKNFGDALYFLRGNRLIDYKQLGLKYKLYLCEILLNRGIAQVFMSNDNLAREDFLQALQSRVEPKHNVIEDVLLLWQRGQSMEPFSVPAHALFQPSKSKLDALVKKDYLGKSKVVASIQEFKFPETPPSERRASNSSKENDPKLQTSPKNSLNMEFKFGRDRLLKDLRKKETRQSLKRVPQSRPPSKPLPILPSRRASPPNGFTRRSLSPIPGESSPVDRRQQTNRSPSSRKKYIDGAISPPNILPPRKYSGGDQSKPPSKPLPPSPMEPRRSAFSTPPGSPGVRRVKPMVPIPPMKNQNGHLEVPSKDHVTVNVQYIVTRTMKVNRQASTQQLSRAAAEALNVSPDTFTMCYSKNNELTSVEGQNLDDLWSTANNGSLSIYCYEKPE